MEPECTFNCYRTQTVDGEDCVAIMFAGEVVMYEDEGGQLYPVIGLTPGVAMKAAEALVQCAGEIVRGFED